MDHRKSFYKNITFIFRSKNTNLILKFEDLRYNPKYFQFPKRDNKYCNYESLGLGLTGYFDNFLTEGKMQLLTGIIY